MARQMEGAEGLLGLGELCNSTIPVYRVAVGPERWKLLYPYLCERSRVPGGRTYHGLRRLSANTASIGFRRDYTRMPKARDLLTLWSR